MENMSLDSTPTSGESTTSLDSNAAAAVLMVVGVAAMAGTYYAVRRGIDRQIVRRMREHRLNKK
jgi:hypothetical protein